jgi:hypothetical protein
MTTTEILELSIKEKEEFCSKHDYAPNGISWDEFEKVTLDKFVAINTAKFTKDSE